FPVRLSHVDPTGFAGGVDGVVWRSDGEAWTVLRRHRGPVTALLGEGSGGLDGRVFDGATHAATHAAPVTCLVRSDGRLWSAAGDGTVWDGRAMRQVHRGPVTAMVAEGGGVWTVGADGKLLHVDADGATSERLDAGVALDAVAVHEGVMAVGAADGTLHVDGVPQRLADVPVFFVARWASGWVAATTDGRVHAAGRSFAVGARGTFPCVLDPDGLRIWVGSGGGARAWDLASGRPVGVLDAVGGSGGSNGIAVTDDEVWAWDFRLALWPRIPPAFTADHTCFVRGELRPGDRRVTWASDGCVGVRGAEGEPLALWGAHGDTIWSTALSPDGGRLATGTDRDVAVWDLADGACLGRWSVPGRAVAWLDGERVVAGGRLVRLAVLAPGAEAEIRATAGNAFQQQTQRITVLPDGTVLTGSTIGTDGWCFPAGGGAPVPHDLGPAASADARPESPPVPHVKVPRVDGEPPRWPDELGPAWLRSWVEEAITTWRPRADHHATLLAAGLPAADPVVAWEAGMGGWRVSATSVGQQACWGDPTTGHQQLPDGEVALLVGSDWPSTFFASADGTLWERALGRWSALGPVQALRPLLALRSAAGTPLATVSFDGAVGDAVAAALGAESVDLGTSQRWWLGQGVRMDEDASGTRVVASTTAALVASLDAGGPARVTAASPRVKELPLAEAPRGDGGLEVERGKKPGLVIREAVGGTVVEEVVIRGTTARATRWIAVSGAEPACLSERARTWLAERKARSDRRLTASADALGARLAELGYAASSAAVRAEELVGGLSFPDPRAESDEPWITLGTLSYLSVWPEGWSLGDAERDAGTVPLAYGPGDGVWVLFADGGVGWQEMVAMPGPVRVADDVVPWLERVIRTLASPEPLKTFEGRRGVALAETLGCVPVPEATDGVEAWWSGEGVEVSEEVDLGAAMEREERVVTRVRAVRSAKKRVTAALR
ncbi:MAG: hypothetical protein KC621_19915, partial [Myxococcales bacterium]|nr:hypothetical protein [Myxococcales bacterium]